MRLCSFSFLCKWGKYCVFYIIIDLFFPFNNRETRLICCVVFLKHECELFSCSDTDGHFQSFDVSNNTVLSSSSTPATAQAWVFLRAGTKKWNSWVIGRGWQCSPLPCCLPSREMYKFPYLSMRLSVHMLNALWSRRHFCQLPSLICHVFTVTQTLMGTMGSWHLCAEHLWAKCW